MTAKYLVWGLLPFILFVMAVWAGFRRTGKQGVRDYAGSYLTQAIFCSLMLVAAIGVDRFFFDARINNWFPALGEMTVATASWLTYPALLLLVAEVHKFRADRKYKGLTVRERIQSGV